MPFQFYKFSTLRVTSSVVNIPELGGKKIPVIRFMRGKQRHLPNGKPERKTRYIAFVAKRNNPWSPFLDFKSDGSVRHPEWDEPTKPHFIVRLGRGVEWMPDFCKERGCEMNIPLDWMLVAAVPSFCIGAYIGAWIMHDAILDEIKKAIRKEGENA